MTGADYIAEFLAAVGSHDVFLLNGGACAFMVDAVARHPNLRHACFQHEQAAAMAADAVWRVHRRVGVTLATSGPGATNLITGIATSYFDSIPTLHITGQVNQHEQLALGHARPRQAGFQETRIVDMVRPVTKHAVMVRNTDELRHELARAYSIAISGRMGPVLVDVPMDVQQETVTGPTLLPNIPQPLAPSFEIVPRIDELLAQARRPLVLWGGGVNLAGVQTELATWLRRCGLPFVASWAGMSGFDHSAAGYVGQIGVYGNRGANFVVQNADALLVLGSRLDSRQRSGNPRQFASGAKVYVLDVDAEELAKFASDGYRTDQLDFAHLPAILDAVTSPVLDEDWMAYVGAMKRRWRGAETSTTAREQGTLSPYAFVRRLAEVVEDDAVVIADTGAALCWLYQAFEPRGHTLFNPGGNSPMGYALPAAIGVRLSGETRQVICYTGDGGLQVNLQELQTIAHHRLDVAIVAMNNRGYGIISQFQDSYLGGRHVASLDGYSAPDFAAIAAAFGLRHVRIDHVDQLTREILQGGASIIEVMLAQGTLIEPKLEMGRPINDQSPYLDEIEYAQGNQYVAYARAPSRAQTSKEELQ